MFHKQLRGSVLDIIRPITWGVQQEREKNEAYLKKQING